ncbi:MAG TPA: 6-carboxytetrahydropterin synthase QueD [Planctomycetota bacterium]|nr:6-carboxytetrahydropterin synthase QueD [Planctomycetota bacterium]
MYEVSVEGHFAAAHNLRGYQGNCEHLHGHNWRVKATVAADCLDPIGMAVDFRVLKRGLGAILEELDHKYLNKDVAAFRDGASNPTTENLAREIFARLGAPGALPDGVRPLRVTVWESPGCSASYTEE